MRLLDLVAGEFVEFSDSSMIPPYAILSHRWDTTEQTYQDVREIQRSCERNRQFVAVAASPPPFGSSSPNDNSAILPLSSPQSIWDLDSGLSDKVRCASEAARKDGFQYLWIDSCCIDKTSSSELSESINSMFAWYRDAAVCYAFLSDVPTLPFASLSSEGSAFRSSKWFTRGWTLQELIAPHRLVFLSQTWELLGTKLRLSRIVQEITGIPELILASESGRELHESLDTCSVAQRMSWAARRETTRVEDQAYSLLGIFDIYMSTLYGEGNRAFRRLQEEILRRIPDQTIFAWGPIFAEAFPSLTDSAGPANELKDAKSASEDAYHGELDKRYTFRTGGPFHPFQMLASSPRDFVRAGNVVPVPHSTFVDLLARYWPISPQEYTSTPHGIRTEFPLLPLSSCFSPDEVLFEVVDGQPVHLYLAILACEQSEFPGQLLCRICHVHTPEQPVNVLHPSYLGVTEREVGGSELPMWFGILRFTPNHEPWLVQLRVHTVFLAHLPRSPPAQTLRPIKLMRTGKLITLTLPTWCRDALDAKGYAVSLEGPSEPEFEGGGSVHRLMLSPQPPTHPGSGWARWSVVADFSYEWLEGGDWLDFHAIVHFSRNGGCCMQRVTWTWYKLSLGWSAGWGRDSEDQALKRTTMRCGTLDLELGLRPEVSDSVSCWHIHVDIVSELPASPDHVLDVVERPH